MKRLLIVAVVMASLIGAPSLFACNGYHADQQTQNQ